MATTLDMSVVLMGLKHSGKSTLASTLAEQHKCDYTDLDDLIETAYRSDRLVSCREIYSRHGREYFMELEAESAKRLRNMLANRRLVAALGGGTGENTPAMSAIAGAGTLVYLCDKEEILFERIMQRGRPAFLPESNTAAAFHEIFARRDLLYRRYADVIVELDGASKTEAYELLVNTLSEKNNAG